MLAPVLALAAVLASALALAAVHRTNRRVGSLAARVNDESERGRVLALLNRRLDCGHGEALTWKVWRRKIVNAARYTGAERASAAHPKVSRRSLP